MRIALLHALRAPAVDCEASEAHDDAPLEFPIDTALAAQALRQLHDHFEARRRAQERAFGRGFVARLERVQHVALFELGFVEEPRAIGLFHECPEQEALVDGKDVTRDLIGHGVLGPQEEGGGRVQAVTVGGGRVAILLAGWLTE